jgi:hypothetical protein
MAQSGDRDLADEDIADLHGAHSCLRILCTAVVADKALADVAEERR